MFEVNVVGKYYSCIVHITTYMLKSERHYVYAHIESQEQVSIHYSFITLTLPFFLIQLSSLLQSKTR